MCSAVFWHFPGTRYVQSSDLRLWTKFHIKHGFRWRCMARPILWSLTILKYSPKYEDNWVTWEKKKPKKIPHLMAYFQIHKLQMASANKEKLMKMHLREKRHLSKHRLTYNATSFSGLSLLSVLHVKFRFTTWPNFTNDTNWTWSQTGLHHEYDLCLEANQEQQFVWHQCPTV